MRRTSKLLGAVGVACAAAAGGSAFTASVTVPAQVVGYKSTTVTGGTVTSIVYNLNALKTNVDTLTVTMSGDTHTSALFTGFDGAAPTACGTGVFASGATDYTCPASGTFSESTLTLSSVEVVLN